MDKLILGSFSGTDPDSDGRLSSFQICDLRLNFRNFQSIDIPDKIPLL